MKTETLPYHFSLTSDSTAKFNMTSLHWCQEMSHVSLIGLRAFWLKLGSRERGFPGSSDGKESTCNE